METLKQWFTRALGMIKGGSISFKLVGICWLLATGVLFVLAGLLKFLALIMEGGRAGRNSDDFEDGPRDISHNSGSPVRIEVLGANGRWSAAGSANSVGSAVSLAMERALRSRRDATKARAIDQRSGAVVDFMHR